jgi:hypothetical protein
MTATKKSAAKKRPVASARKAATQQPRRPAPKKASGDWVLGPYGDLMSRADYDAMMQQQKQS